MALLAMSKKEIDRHEVISRVIRKEITAQKAGELVGLCKRQIKRLKKRVKKNGAKGLIHGNRGKPGNRRIPDAQVKKIITLLKEKYPDFGPTFASEKLSENHSLSYDPKTIRSLQITEGLWTPRKGKNISGHRDWRARKEAYGEMLQYDGSYHNWFEGRGETNEQCLLATIDDATGIVVKAALAPHEGVIPTFAFWREYVLAHGTPRCIYLDKFSTYKVNHTIASENPDTKTQFHRACSELGIQLIFANSPEAKGRVERLFQTFQDRLIKELRLKNISTPEEANTFLAEEFLPTFNAKFSVEPVSKANLHRALVADEKKQLNSIFSRHTERTVRNDFTISMSKQWYQITATQSIAVRKKDVVIVEEHIDGTIHIRLRGKELNYTILPERPQKTKNTQWVLALTREVVKPAADHPWRVRMTADIERKKYYESTRVQTAA